MKTPVSSSAASIPSEMIDKETDLKQYNHDLDVPSNEGLNGYSRIFILKARPVYH